MSYPRLTIAAVFIGLLLTAGHAFVHTIAITVFALLAYRCSSKELTFATFAFATALLLSAGIDRSPFAIDFTAPWGDRRERLPLGNYFLSIGCLVCLLFVHRSWTVTSFDRRPLADAESTDSSPPGVSALLKAARSDDPGSTESDELKFTVSESELPEAAHEQRTHFMMPWPSSSGSRHSYDVNPDDVLDQLVSRLSAHQLRGYLKKARISIPAPLEAEAHKENSAAALVRRMIGTGALTKFQAMLICGGLPELIWIGDYEVLERIGRGGMAVVLKVRDRHSKHDYALKLLADLGAIDDVVRNRFLREMEAVRGLAHPNIAIARAVGEHHQSLYIAMEWVQGDNLAHYVHEHGPLPASEAIDFIRQAAAALQHAHQRGLIHRDVKPANLMLDRNRQIKLVDMGLARFADAMERKLDSRADGWRTDTGHLMGTIDYMAPEQAMDLSVADQRSDIYSLGCTLFYLLTGDSHLRGRTQRGRAVGLVRQTGMRDLMEVRKDLPECVYALAGKMMCIAPEGRFQNAAELLVSIDACASLLGMPAASGRPYHVLVVEDSPTQSLLTCQQLQAASQHFVPLDVPTLAIACQQLQSRSIDLVILDLNLPDSRGISTIERVRQVDGRTPILVLTSHNDPRLGTRCIAAGADDFLPKEALEVSTLERHILLILSRRASSNG